MPTPLPAQKEPSGVVRYCYFIVGQLPGKRSGVLLEVACIKAKTCSPPNHGQVRCRWMASAIPLKQLAEVTSDCPIAGLSDI